MRDMSRIIASNAVRWRFASGKSRQEIAVLSGLSKKTVGNVERGDGASQPQTIQKLNAGLTLANDGEPVNVRKGYDRRIGYLSVYRPGVLPVNLEIAVIHSEKILDETVEVAGATYEQVEMELTYFLPGPCLSKSHPYPDFLDWRERYLEDVKMIEVTPKKIHATIPRDIVVMAGWPALRANEIVYSESIPLVIERDRIVLGYRESVRHSEFGHTREIRNLTAQIEHSQASIARHTARRKGLEDMQAKLVKDWKS